MFLCAVVAFCLYSAHVLAAGRERVRWSVWLWLLGDDESVGLCLDRTVRRGHSDPSPDPAEHGRAAGQRTEGPGPLLRGAAGAGIPRGRRQVRLGLGLWEVP